MKEKKAPRSWLITVWRSFAGYTPIVLWAEIIVLVAAWNFGPCLPVGTHFAFVPEEANSAPVFVNAPLHCTCALPNNWFPWPRLQEMQGWWQHCPDHMLLDSGCVLTRSVRIGWSSYEVIHSLFPVRPGASIEKATQSDAFKALKHVCGSILHEDASAQRETRLYSLDEVLRRGLMSNSMEGPTASPVAPTPRSGRWVLGHWLSKTPCNLVELIDNKYVIALSVLAAIVVFLPLLFLPLLLRFLPSRRTWLKLDTLGLVPAFLLCALTAGVSGNVLRILFQGGQIGHEVTLSELARASLFPFAFLLLWAALIGFPRVFESLSFRRMAFGASALALIIGQVWLFLLESPLAPAALCASVTGVAVCVLLAVGGSKVPQQELAASA